MGVVLGAGLGVVFGSEVGVRSQLASEPLGPQVSASEVQNKGLGVRAGPDTDVLSCMTHAGLFRAMNGKSVTIRLLDPPLHEFLPQVRSCGPPLSPVASL